MNTAVLITLLLLSTVAYGAYSGVQNIRKLQNMGMQAVIDQGDSYLRETYPWTYGNAAGVRDWWYDP
jgi:hypothetical protein